MRIRLGQYYWSASLPITLLAGAAIGLLLFLGTWQLQRAEQKAVIFDNFATGGSRVSTRAPVRFAGARYTTVRIRGSYIPDRQVLIDNITHAGRVGY